MKRTQMTTRVHLTRWLVTGVLLSTWSLSGCGQGLGGGAAFVPRVRILPDADAAGLVTGGAAADVQVAGYGTLRGRVVLDGPAPSLPPILQQDQIKPADAAVCVYEKMPRHENLVVAADGALANVFIYLPKAPPGTKQPEGTLEPLKFDQEVCTFQPRCLVAQAGQTILVLNSDNLAHNTHTFPNRNAGFNSTVSPGEKVGVPLVYTRSEAKPVRVTCDFHAWMAAFHLPLDHPYGAVSGVDGTFEIANLPAGKHEFTIWHEVAGDINKRFVVEVPVDGVAEVEIKVPAQSMAQFEGERSKRVVLSMIP
ncbi:MAG: hypothetical protein KF861_21195 [Planctomycetaceae bacterium]|nr:hypothetical protein [Planctomycetaceae bacterium]